MTCRYPQHPQRIPQAHLQPDGRRLEHRGKYIGRGWWGRFDFESQYFGEEPGLVKYTFTSHDLDRNRLQLGGELIV
jgi:hypothetical protein